MNIFPSPYLYQTAQWQQFWLSTHNNKHQCFDIVALDSSHHGTVTLRGTVYLYQWAFGQNLMHLPAGPYLEYKPDTQDSAIKTTPSEVDITLLKELFLDFLSKIHSIARDHQVVALRLNMDHNLAYTLDIHNSDDIISLIDAYKRRPSVGLPVHTQSRHMFPTIAIVTTDSLSTPPPDQLLTPSILAQYIKQDKQFWLTLSETTRKQTRKSTKTQNIVFDTELTTHTITEAYALMAYTSQRQNFTLPSLDYFITLAQQDNIELLLIRDTETGVAHAAWIGIRHNKTLTNQYAGNSAYAFKHMLPNLTHLYGLYRARQLGHDWYDLGGYDKGSPQARFKDGYRPTIISFVGGIDLVYLPWYYRIIELGSKGRKLFNP